MVAITDAIPIPAYPWQEWGSVRDYVDKAWDPKNCPHHSIIGLTGSGKSYLAVNGILKPMCSMDRVLIIDTKKDDETITSVGKPVKAIPEQRWWSSLGGAKERPYNDWYRLLVHENHAKARNQVYGALARVYKEGDWVVYVDEMYDIAGPKRPSLNLGPWIEQIYRKGRYKHISVIAGTQSPAWVPRAFYDQASFAWIGRIRDEDRQKRLLEIGGMSKKDLPILSQLRRRQWLLAADNGEYFARTTVKV